MNLLICLNLSCFFFFASCTDNNISKHIKEISQDSIKYHDSIEKMEDTSWVPNRSVNAELIGWDSSVNLALTATFSQKELNAIKETNQGTFTVYCFFSGSGNVTKVFMDYCKCGKLIQSKFKILLNNFERFIQFRVQDYDIDRLKKGKVLYTAFLVADSKLFSVDEIGEVDSITNKKLNAYNDTTRICR